MVYYQFSKNERLIRKCGSTFYNRNCLRVPIAPWLGLWYGLDQVKYFALTSMSVYISLVAEGATPGIGHWLEIRDLL